MEQILKNVIIINSLELSYIIIIAGIKETLSDPSKNFVQLKRL